MVKAVYHRFLRVEGGEGGDEEAKSVLEGEDLLGPISKKTPYPHEYFDMLFYGIAYLLAKI